MVKKEKILSWFVYIYLILAIQFTACSRKDNTVTVSELFDNHTGTELVSSVVYADGFDIYEVGNVKKTCYL